MGGGFVFSLHRRGGECLLLCGMRRLADTTGYTKGYVFKEATSDTIHWSEWNQFYKEALENASQFNSRLITERRMRLPYLDSHTGVAQNNCHIWFEKYERGAGLEDGQLYTYPARRWRKRPKMSQIMANDSGSRKSASEGDAAEGDISLDSFQDETSQDMYTGSQEKEAAYADLYFKEFDPQEDFRDAGEIDRAESEESDEDFEISYKKKKPRGRGRGGGRGRKSADGDGTPGLSEKEERLYPCKYCSKKYKNRQGRTYHTMHHHHDKDQNIDDIIDPPPPASAESEDPDKERSGPPLPKDRPQNGKNGILFQVLTAENAQDASNPSTAPAEAKEGAADPNNYCDFCLGDATENKKTGTQEELISCADCGRSGHPSCLQFTDVMIAKVKGYKWQCIECKSCGLCGTSDNDDQLLFCDDCDRGYHMYCLNPPMSAPPEGSWVCDLCMKDGRYDNNPSSQET